MARRARLLALLGYLPKRFMAAVCAYVRLRMLAGLCAPAIFVIVLLLRHRCLVICDSSSFRLCGTVLRRNRVGTTDGGEYIVQGPVRRCTPELFGSTGAAESGLALVHPLVGSLCCLPSSRRRRCFLVCSELLFSCRVSDVNLLFTPLDTVCSSLARSLEPALRFEADILAQVGIHGVQSVGCTVSGNLHTGSP